MVGFHSFLCSVSGGAQEPEVAKQIVTDVSKVLYFLDLTEIDWTKLADEINVLQYFNKLQQITKLDRIGSALKYIKEICGQQLADGIMDSKDYLRSVGILERMSTSVKNWKSSLRKDKRRLAQGRLEDLSELSNDMSEISRIVDNKEIWDRFHSIVKKARGGSSPSKDQLRFGMSCVLVSLLYSSYQRPGAACNCEFLAAAEVEKGYHAISVRQHKTGQHGTAKLTLDDRLMHRQRLYYKNIRPLLVRPGHDINLLFILPGSKKIDKFTDIVSRLERALQIDIPNPTMVRKIGCTSEVQVLYISTW